MSDPTSYSSLRDLKRAKGSAPSQGWQGPRTKWSGAREHSTSYVDPHPAPAPVPGPSTPYSSGPYGAPNQQNVASGISGDPGASRTRDAGSRFADRYAGQRSYSAADAAPAERAEPKRGGSWSSWLGGKSEQEQAHASHPPPAGHSSQQPRTHDTMPERPRRGRYIPPSERKPGDPMFEPAARPPPRGPRTTDPDDEDEEPDPNDNSWGAWAARQTKAANVMMQTASEKLNDGWDSVNDANKRDKVGSVALGASGKRKAAAPSLAGVRSGEQQPHILARPSVPQLSILRSALRSHTLTYRHCPASARARPRLRAAQ